jgi:hypothetical protein
MSLPTPLKNIQPLCTLHSHFKCNFRAAAPAETLPIYLK